MDILIKNATIVDGSGQQPAFQGDLAVQGDRIAAMGKLDSVQADKVIDATGKALAPGFIDMHSHADLSLIVAPEGDSLVMQGITTIVGGQCGISAAPLNDRYRKDVMGTVGMLVPPEAEIPWDAFSTFASYLEYTEKNPPAVNVAPLVGQGMIRAAAMGYTGEKASPEQIKAMQHLVEEAMQAGAFGISTGLIYPPGSFTTTAELEEVVKPVGARGRLYFTHMRDESDGILDSIRETLGIGLKTGANVQISHLKVAGTHNWNKVDAVLGMIDEARAAGQNVTADMYPYVAGSTLLAAILPKWVVEGGVRKVLQRLILPWERRKIINEMKEKGGGVTSKIEWDKVLISRSRKEEYAGHYVSELAQKDGKDPNVWVLDAILKTGGKTLMVVFLMSEDNVRRQLAHPAVMVGTDGLGITRTGPMSRGLPHPRSCGTYPRIFGQYVREEKLLTLEQAAWKCSGFPAQKLGITDRGILKEGMKADLVLFDPQAIEDKATYMEPLIFPAGIEQVMVNGKFVVQDGKQTTARPGAVLRAH